MRRLDTYLLLAVLFSAAAFPGHADPDGLNASLEHQRVLWMKNPAGEAVISWTTREEWENHRVYYDTVPRGGDPDAYARQADSFLDGEFTMTAADTRWSRPGYYHHVHLDQLEPSTAYHFVMASGPHVSREFHFVTAPRDDRPFAILFGGDSRIGRETGPSSGLDPYDHNDRRKMNLRMAALVEERPEIMALAHGGDYCLTAEWRYLERWLEDHELLRTGSGRLLPIIPARGNHDRQIGFEEVFAWPGRERDYYYATRLSREAVLLTLNTEISLGGNQREWLEAQLSRLRPANRWLFAQYHRPAYSSVRAIQDGAGRRQHWVPLFERYNIDLACESHDHAMKRTAPIRDGKVDHEDGIVYIGDGGLGVPQREPDANRWWFQEPGFALAAHHVHLLEFGRDELRVRAFGMEGELLDDFRVVPRTIPTSRPRGGP